MYDLQLIKKIKRNKINQKVYFLFSKYFCLFSLKKFEEETPEIYKINYVMRSDDSQLLNDISGK